ncbi:MAG: hypothetical protein QOJ71_2157 [Actinomycetota bacterium]|nr:hypothetical protein [Actinomycetota bacterium]
MTSVLALRRTGVAGGLLTSFAGLGGMFLAVVAPPAAAISGSTPTVLYVATPPNGGSDSHACTQSAPCATVQRAVDVSGPGGTIHVGAGTFVGRVDFTGSSLTVVGAGQEQTFLDGGGLPVVVWVSQESSGAPNTYRINDLTVQHADGTGAHHTGGITLLRGFLDLVRVTITANVGFGVFNESSYVSIADSTISDNSATGLENFEGDMDVSGSTFTGNGSGISDESGVSTFTNITVAENTHGGFSASNTARPTITASTIASNGGTGIAEGGFIQGGLVAGVTVGSTIIANNAGGNCYISVGHDDSGYFKDSGYNLESDGGASCTFSGAKHDLVGGSPHLGPLQDNGGPTYTMLPAAASPVVNALPTSTGLCPRVDQRKVTRPQGAACDIGAVEREAPQGVIFAVTFKNCSLLHVGYNRFKDGTVVRWTVSSNGFGQVASGSFTAIGGGSAGSKTFHFLTQPLGTTLHPDPVHSHVHFTWPNGGKYVVTRNPTCPTAAPAPAPVSDVSHSVRSG